LLLGAAWLLLVWIAYLKRGTPLALRVQGIEVAWRAVLIPTLWGVGAWSLFGDGPFREPWMAAKLIVYGALLVIGLYLRGTIALWREGFRRMAAEGPGEAANALFHKGHQRAKPAAYVFWTLIAVVAWLGIRQPV
jgi:hypothetical protein